MISSIIIHLLIQPSIVTEVRDELVNVYVLIKTTGV